MTGGRSRDAVGRRVIGTAVAAVSTRAEPLPTPLAEPRRGYRFGPENLVVADLAPAAVEGAGPVGTVVDLGAGCGVLGLVAGFAVRADAIVLVERDPDLAAFCRHNAAALSVPVRVVEDDLRSSACGIAPGSADLVVTNPPFFDDGEGRPSANPMVHHATHALHGDVSAFVGAADRLLAPDGTLLLVYPADRMGDALGAVTAAGLSARRITVLHARHTGRPYRAWIVASRRPGPLEVVQACTLTRR